VQVVGAGAQRLPRQREFTVEEVNQDLGVKHGLSLDLQCPRHQHQHVVADHPELGDGAGRVELGVTETGSVSA
jgi:hypothetical protein